MQAKAEELLNGWLQGGKPFKSRPFADGVILHAHDWLAHYSGAYLKHAYRLPLIATIHATEYGRNNGLHNDLQRYIASVEWQLSYEAWRVICCSWYMKGEVEFALQTPSDKIVVIPNGVDATKFEFKFDEAERQAFRNNYAAPDEKILFFVGRMVREKGAHILLEALPKVRVVYPKVKLLIVGGGYRDHLVQLANWLGIAPHVYFTGFVPDDVLLRIYRIADVAVFPSLYEPFGIVALEAMAARIPVVVSDAGGLKEVVEHNVTGVVTWLNNSDSLAWGILEVLQNPDRASPGRPSSSTDRCGASTERATGSPNPLILPPCRQVYFRHADGREEGSYSGCFGSEQSAFRVALFSTQPVAHRAGSTGYRAVGGADRHGSHHYPQYRPHRAHCVRL
jgi:glycosyltransferase involved in cell wall biosynthesis